MPSPLVHVGRFWYCRCVGVIETDHRTGPARRAPHLEDNTHAVGPSEVALLADCRISRFIDHDRTRARRSLHRDRLRPDKLGLHGPDFERSGDVLRGPLFLFDHAAADRVHVEPPADVVRFELYPDLHSPRDRFDPGADDDSLLPAVDFPIQALC